eukprot:11187352-Alexandrium_andersonii.AAC.1
MRLQNDTKPRDAEELWKLIKHIQPTNPAGFLRPMRRSEFNTGGHLPEEMRPEDGLVFKFLNPINLELLPEWRW